MILKDGVWIRQARAALSSIDLHVAESPGSIVEMQDALGRKNLATTHVYVRRIAVKRDKFGAEVAKRMKL